MVNEGRDRRKDAGKTPARRKKDINRLLTKLRQAAGMKWFIPLILLAACGASPSPLLIGAQRQDVVVDGRSYTVFWTRNMVEVIRLGWAPVGSHYAIRATMVDLITKVTHCRLSETSLVGDSGEMRGAISCPQVP